MNVIWRVEKWHSQDTNKAKNTKLSINPVKVGTSYALFIFFFSFVHKRHPFCRTILQEKRKAQIQCTRFLASEIKHNLNQRMKECFYDTSSWHALRTGAGGAQMHRKNDRREKDMEGEEG